METYICDTSWFSETLSKSIESTFWFESVSEYGSFHFMLLAVLWDLGLIKTDTKIYRLCVLCRRLEESAFIWFWCWCYQMRYIFWIFSWVNGTEYIRGKWCLDSKRTFYNCYHFIHASTLLLYRKGDDTTIYSMNLLQKDWTKILLL